MAILAVRSLVRGSGTALLCLATFGTSCAPGPTLPSGGETATVALSPGVAEGRNVLLITLDTTRADHLGAYGYEGAETPALDRLAAAGIRFDDAVATAPATLPSHATILTGLYPPRHGVRNNGEFRLSQEHTTLPEVLSAAGYDTAAFVSAFVLDRRYGLDQGFAIYDDRVESTTGARFAGQTNERSAAAVSDAAIAWLKQRDDDRPFFAWVHYFDPHHPYEAPPDIADRFAGRAYDAEISYMDREIGRLLAMVEELRPRGNMLTLVVGDHGEGLGDHGEPGHALLVYDSVMRIPLILNLSGSTAIHAVDDRVVTTADIVPTLLDLLGIDDPDPRDGISWLGPTPLPDRSVYVESLLPYLDHGWAPLYALRRHHDKLILGPQPEYYDLRADPGETENLYDSTSSSIRLARDALEEELSVRLRQDAGIEVVAAAAQPLDPAASRRLKALGYLTGEGPDRGDGTLDPKGQLPVLAALHKADELYRRGELRAALGEVHNALERSPRDRRVLQTAAKIYLAMGRLDQAERALRAFVKIRPSADVCLLLAQILILDGRHEEASELLNVAASLEPEHGGVFIARGDLELMRGRERAALSAYVEARRVDPYRATGTAAARIEHLRQRASIPAAGETNDGGL